MDYLKKYVTQEGFDIPRMLNDDFFLSIKMLLNSQYYISATKLLLSFIDTMAYLETGDGGGPAFKSWSNRYLSLDSLGITAEELWEHRNSLLHMSTSDSRKVTSGKVCRLIAYVGILPPNLTKEDVSEKWFDLYGLLLVVAKGLECYLESMRDEPQKFIKFCERYDQILSDTRVEVFHLSENR